MFTEPLNLSRKSLGNCGILKGNYNYIISTHGREWELAILDIRMAWIICRWIGVAWLILRWRGSFWDGLANFEIAWLISRCLGSFQDGLAHLVCPAIVLGSKTTSPTGTWWVASLMFLQHPVVSNPPSLTIRIYVKQVWPGGTTCLSWTTLRQKEEDQEH